MVWGSEHNSATKHCGVTMAPGGFGDLKCFVPGVLARSTRATGSEGMALLCQPQLTMSWGCEDELLSYCHGVKCQPHSQHCCQDSTGQQ